MDETVNLMQVIQNNNPDLFNAHMEDVQMEQEKMRA